MSTIATERPRTLDQARDRIAALESQLNLRGPGADEVVSLKAENAALKSQLVSKDSEIRALNGRLSSSSSAPATTQPSPQRPLAEMSKKEIGAMLDAATARGDKRETKRLWSEFCSR